LGLDRDIVRLKSLRFVGDLEGDFLLNIHTIRFYNFLCPFFLPDLEFHVTSFFLQFDLLLLLHFFLKDFLSISGVLLALLHLFENSLVGLDPEALGQQHVQL